MSTISSLSQEDKEVLLKDLCARLPYSVKCEIDDIDEPLELESIKFKGDYFIFGNGVYERYITEIKPYLRPMPSMTEKERGEYRSFIFDYEYDDYWNPGKYSAAVEVYIMSELIDWLNAHHFDYRHLIECGLALPAPEGMYNI